MENVTGGFQVSVKSFDEAFKFCQMMSEMGMKKPVPSSLEEELDILVHSVNPIRLKNNPVELDEQTIMSIYEEVLS